MVRTIKTLTELEEFGDTLLSDLTPGNTATILALTGELGTGKTTLVQHLARRLGVTEAVTSPTFLVMKHYPLSGQKWEQLIHMDLYRVESEEELRVLGVEKEFQNPNNLICIEWAERFKDLIPGSRTWITLTHTSEGDRTLEYAKS